MANMSYIRFENTYKDLVDCMNALNGSGADSLSDSELRYAKLMMHVCENILNHEGEVEDETEARKEEIED